MSGKFAVLLNYAHVGKIEVEKRKFFIDFTNFFMKIFVDRNISWDMTGSWQDGTTYRLEKYHFLMMITVYLGNFPTDRI